MRKQIRGLDQASANAQDGISAVQTAEGALNEVQDMLQRMNELAVQSANGTNSVSDRQSIQDEIDQLATEIDRVSETTKFNETYLLKGDKNAPRKSSFSYGPATDNDITAVVDMDGQGATNVTDIATGLDLAVDFSTATAAAEDQNAIAKSLRDQGFLVSEEIIDDGTNSQTTKTRYHLSLNGEAAKNYSVNATDPDAGLFQIVDRKGNIIADVTVSDGNLTRCSKL